MQNGNVQKSTGKGAVICIPFRQEPHPCGYWRRSTVLVTLTE